VPEPTLADVRRALREAPDLHPAHVFAGMPFVFRGDRAGGLSAVFFFDLSGSHGGRWSVRIGGGRCETGEGAPEQWDVMIACDTQTFLDLATARVRPGEAFIEGKLSVAGDLALGMRFSKLFGADGDA
jgi:putative sterol carrier protein